MFQMELVRPTQFKSIYWCQANQLLSTRTTRTPFLPQGRKPLTLFPKPHSVFCYASLSLGLTSTDVFSQVQINPEVLFTALGASASLFSACALVAWMQKSGYIPAETPVILSQVAFRISVPCFLMSKVSKVLATQASGNVAVIPLIGVLQVVLGISIARLVCILLYGTGEDTKLIAKKKALVTTACGFGNAMSLPLLFLSGVLPPHQASLATGYLALYIVGWSPAIWTVAYQILKSATKGNQEDERLPLADIARKWYKRIVNPPLLGIIFGSLIGLTPLSRPIFFQKTTVLARLLQPVFDAGVFLGSGAPAMQVTVLACSLAGVMKSRSARMPHFWGPRKMRATGHLPVLDAGEEPVLLEGKELLAIFVVRSLLNPFFFCVSLTIAERLKVLTLDPICKLTMMVLAAMPSAQNLVVLAQIRSSTRPLAKEIASLLLIQYTASLVPISVWLSLFLSITNVQCA